MGSLLIHFSRVGSFSSRLNEMLNHICNIGSEGDVSYFLFYGYFLYKEFKCDYDVKLYNENKHDQTNKQFDNIVNMFSNTIYTAFFFHTKFQLQ